ncbi:uncharacterized protein LOC121391198 [Gigantopelta aegis]|uniref:uncharacterized protein LOC121391198 n=1 Tax=Gigantopelta aegis TaxID=1735272 RepID=UPI001B88B0DD|nr:uncharacterized protein LOC121391198 [Gigantopelta aegis]
MAAVVPLEIQYRPFITCGICYDTYTDPRVLTCCHTFCLACLTSYISGGLIKNIIKEKHAFPCPFCQELVKPPQPEDLPNAWAQQFSVNNEVASLLLKIEEERKERLTATIRQSNTTLTNQLQNLQVGERTENIVLPLFVPSAPPEYDVVGDREMTPQDIPSAPPGYEVVGNQEMTSQDNQSSTSAELTEQGATAFPEMEASSQGDLVRYEYARHFSAQLPDDRRSIARCGICLMDGGNVVVVSDYGNCTIKAYYNVHDEMTVDTLNFAVSSSAGAVAISDDLLVVMKGYSYEAAIVSVCPKLNIDSYFHLCEQYNVLVPGVNNTFIGLYHNIFNRQVIIDVMDTRGVVLKNFKESAEWSFPEDNFVPTSATNKFYRRRAATMVSLIASESALKIDEDFDQFQCTKTKLSLSDVYAKSRDNSQLDKDKDCTPVAIFFSEEDNACVIDAAHKCIVMFPIACTSEAKIIPIVSGDISLADVESVKCGTDGKLFCISVNGTVSVFSPLYGVRL